jgi:hypothetical protein
MSWTLHRRMLACKQGSKTSKLPQLHPFREFRAKDGISTLKKNRVNLGTRRNIRNNRVNLLTSEYAPDDIAEFLR